MDHKSESKDAYYENDAKTGMADSKSEDNLEMYADDSKGVSEDPLPTVEIQSIEYTPVEECPVSDPLELTIKFDLDRDVIAGYWKVQFLVDSCDKRIIKVLGEVSLNRNYYILLVSCVVRSGVLDSSAFHLSYPKTSLASHTTIILIFIFPS